MSKSVTSLSGQDIVLPTRLCEHSQAVTRHLYFHEKPGHITLLFQKHPRKANDPLRLKAYPPEIEADPDNARRMIKSKYAVSYVLRGTGSVHYVKENRTFPLQPGTFFQFNGHLNEDIVLHPDPGLLECSACVDGYTGSRLSDVALWNNEVLCAVAGPRQSLVQAYTGLYEAIDDPTSAPRALLRRFVELVEQFDGILAHNDPQRAFREDARRALAGSCGPGDRIQDAARALGLTYESFRQRFRKVFGIPAQEYQLRNRMEKACVLLRDLSVKETAAALGYDDPFVFSRQFKQRMGVTPRDFR